MGKAYPGAYRKKVRDFAEAAGLRQPDLERLQRAALGLEERNRNMPVPYDYDRSGSKAAAARRKAEEALAASSRSHALSRRQLAKAIIRGGIYGGANLPFPGPWGMALDAAQWLVDTLTPGQLDAYFASYGYTLISGPCAGGPEFTEIVTNTSSLGCIGSQARSESPPDWTVGAYGTPQVTTQRGVIQWSMQSCPAFPGSDYETCLALGGDPRYRLFQQWVRPSGNILSTPPRWHPMPQRFWIQNYLWDPNVLPIGQYVPLARPLPVRQLSRLARQKQKVALEQSPTRRDPVVVRDPVPALTGKKVPLFPSRPIATQVFPGSGGVGIPIKPEYQYSAPPPGDKERKLIISIDPKSPLGIIGNLVTETDDFIEALYFAIPGYLRPYRGRTTTIQRVNAIYKHFNAIDMNKAISNLIENEAGDRIGGSKGRLTREAKQRHFKRTGQSLLPSFY